MTDQEAGEILRLLIIGSLVGPVLFAIVVPILGSLHPDYDHISQQISQLGVEGEPNAMVMRAATSILGVSIIMFAFAVRRTIYGEKGWRIGPALVLIAGICMVAGGIFPCDPGCLPTTFTGNIHRTVSNIGFPAMIIAPFAIALQLRKKESWHNYYHYSITAGIIAAVLVPIYVLEIFENWGGAIQRIILAVLLLWIIGITIKIQRSKKNAP